MSKRTKVIVGGTVVVLGAGWIFSWWIALALILIPVAGYMALDKSQRRRVNRVSRRELNR